MSNMMLIIKVTFLYFLTVLICTSGGKKPYKPSHTEMVKILAGEAEAPPSSKLSARLHSSDYKHSDRVHSMSSTPTSRGPVDQIDRLRVTAEKAKHSYTETIQQQNRKKKANLGAQKQQLSKRDNAMEEILSSSHTGHDRCRFNGTSSFRIVVFVDRPYLNLFKNWLFYYVSVCGTGAIDGLPPTLEIVCMDNVVPKLIVDMSLRCSSFSFLMNSSKSLEQHDIRAKVWIQRVIAMQQMLQHNKTSILVSDLDALWLHDPFPLINQHFATSQIIASRGLWPETVSAAWGATLCMGFMFIKSSEFSIHLLGEMKVQLTSSKSSIVHDSKQKNKVLSRSSGLIRKPVIINEANNKNTQRMLIDDQYWLNTILQAWKLQWKSSKLPLIMNGSIAVDIGKVYRLGSVHTIALLPHVNFVRHCLPNPLHGNYSDRVENLRYLHSLSKQDEVIVLHCLGISGSAIRKNLFFVDYDLWRLGSSDIQKTPVIY